MIKDNPDDTVREEQSEAEIDASGTEDSLEMETSETEKTFESIGGDGNDDKTEMASEEIKKEVESVANLQVADDTGKEEENDGEADQDNKEDEAILEAEPEPETGEETAVDAKAKEETGDSSGKYRKKSLLMPGKLMNPPKIPIMKTQNCRLRTIQGFQGTSSLRRWD